MFKLINEHNKSSEKYNAITIWNEIQQEIEHILKKFLKFKKSSTNQIELLDEDEQEITDLHDQFELKFSFFNKGSSSSSVTSSSTNSSNTSTSTTSTSSRTSNEKMYDFQNTNDFHPSVYYIAAVYRPTVEFIDQATSMIVGDTLKNNQELLRLYINNFVQDHFLPTVQVDLSERLDLILNNRNAFTPFELRYQSIENQETTNETSSSSSSAITSASTPLIPADNEQISQQANSLVAIYMQESKYLYKSVVDVAQLLREVFAGMLLLPHSVIEYLSLAEQLLSTYLNKCHEKYHELVLNSYAAILLADKKHVALMKSYPSYLQFRQINKSNTSSSFFEYSELITMMLNINKAKDLSLIHHDENKDLSMSTATTATATTIHEVDEYDQIKNISLSRDQLLEDNKCYLSLALLCESLDWLSIQTFQVANISSSSSSNTANVSNTMDRGNNFKNKLNKTMNEDDDRRSFLNRRTEETIISNTTDQSKEYATLNVFEAKRFSMADQCQTLSDLCLLTLRLEIQCNLNYYISCIENGVYWCISDVVEAEHFILELNQFLTSIDENLSKYLSRRAKMMMYLFATIPKYISFLIINALANLKHKKS